MKLYFSGFCLNDEKELFDTYLIENDFTVSGFSYGAIKAVEYTLNTTNRIDLLQLLSPAYFNDKDIKYKRMQLMYFNKDSEKYCETFLNNCGLSKKYNKKYFKMGTKKQLEDLLYYHWDKDKLERIINNGTKIEVYLGSEDKIISSKEGKDFFVNFAEVYYIKKTGHIL